MSPSFYFAPAVTKKHRSWINGVGMIGGQPAAPGPLPSPGHEYALQTPFAIVPAIRRTYAGEAHSCRGRCTMATGETGFDDVSFDLISVQYHSLKAGHDYGQYVRDARNAGHEDIASFFEEVMSQDSARAKRCHEFLKELSGSDRSGPAMT
jgi:hypothetical protein